MTVKFPVIQKFFILNFFQFYKLYLILSYAFFSKFVYIKTKQRGLAATSYAGDYLDNISILKGKQFVYVNRSLSSTFAPGYIMSS